MYVEELNSDFTMKKMKKGLKRMECHKAPGDVGVQAEKWEEISIKRVEKFVSPNQ